jgi:hypothetical protein
MGAASQMQQYLAGEGGEGGGHQVPKILNPYPDFRFRSMSLKLDLLHRGHALLFSFSRATPKACVSRRRHEFRVKSE